MKIAILGAGSLGMIHGAFLSKAGYDTTLIDVNKEHVEALNKFGAKIIGLHEEVIPVKASLAKDLNEDFDLVLLHTKQMHMLKALSDISHCINDDTIIVTLENGIPEEKVAKEYGNRVMGGTVFHGAKYIEPGVSELTTKYESMHFYIGELSGKITERAKKVKEIMSSICPVDITTDILSIKWTKLIMNASLSGMSASLGCTFGEAGDNDKSLMAMIHICEEGALVMHQKGLKPIDMEGFCPSVENFSYTSEKQLLIIKKQMLDLISLSYYEIASMLQDIRMGRKECEIQEINGEIVKEGNRLGIPVPFNEKVVELVTKIIAGDMEPVFENIDKFPL